MLRPGLPVAQAIDWVRQAAEGVSAAHALGVVHRDLKPDNLLLTHSGQIKVLDFGIARAMDDVRRHTQLTMAGVIPGTPGYMAPEVCNGALPTPAADVYALGIVLYELLLGWHPLNEPGQTPLSGLQMMFAHVQGDFPRLRTLRADVPESVEQILTQATAKDPAQRFADASGLAAALRLRQPANASHTSVGPASNRFSSPPPVVTNFQLSPIGVAGVGFSPSQPPVFPMHGTMNRAEPRSSKKPIIGFVLLGGMVIVAAAWVTHGFQRQSEIVRQPIVRVPARQPTAKPEVVTQPQTTLPTIQQPTFAQLGLDPNARSGMQPLQSPQPVMAGGDFIATLMQMRQAQFAAGMNAVLPIARGSLVTSGTQNYAVNMVSGHCYKIIGVGAPSVTDLDIKLYAPTNPGGRPGAVADQDIATDNFPVIGLQRPLCPTVAGQYRLEVTMYAGTGEFGIQVFGN